MTYTYSVPNLSGGIDPVIKGISTSVPPFIPMFLVFVYGIITLGGFIAQKNRTGYGDFPMWSTLGGLGTLLVALPLSISAGIINTITLTIVVLVTLISGIWLFLERGKNEI